MLLSAFQTHLDLAAEFLVSCLSPGAADRTQIAKAIRKAVTSGTLNPLLTLANSFMSFCNDKKLT